MYDACTAALGDFVRGAGFTDVVIGLSGGMDSSLVAVMAVDALGADSVHGVMLPGPYSSESSLTDARALATKRMVEEAEALGADAIVAVRYASAAIMQGAAEAIAYGTAVKFI